MFSLLLAALFLGQLPASTSEPRDALPRVLFLTHSAGFVHSVVRRPEDGGLAHAERALVEASRGRLDVTCTQDCSTISAAGLADYDAVLFYTTGELPIPAEDRDALVDWVRDGGAFAGSHCATDTFYEYAPYQEMLGGVFDGHPWHEEVGVVVEDTAHPATRHLGERFRIADEIYQFRDFARHPLHVLVSLDPESVDVARGKRDDGDYAISWCKPYGRGQVFYTSLGHREDVWTDARFLEHLMAGIEWAIGGEPVSPAPPPGATVLFSGAESLAGWTTRALAEVLHREGPQSAAAEASSGTGVAWRVEGDELVVVPGARDIATVDRFGGDFLLHVEFLVPVTPETNDWQDRGNSGVYVQGRYEVQVLDSLGRDLAAGDCGAIYGKHVPPVDACRPAGEWQSFDIFFRSPELDAATGQKVRNASMTVWHNGVRLYDDAPVDSPTTAGMGGPETGAGPLLLQDHGHPVRYRNIWLLPR